MRDHRRRISITNSCYPRYRKNSTRSATCSWRAIFRELRTRCSSGTWTSNAGTRKFETREDETRLRDRPSCDETLAGSERQRTEQTLCRQTCAPAPVLLPDADTRFQTVRYLLNNVPTERGAESPIQCWSISGNSALLPYVSSSDNSFISDGWQIRWKNQIRRRRRHCCDVFRIVHINQHIE